VAIYEESVSLLEQGDHNIINPNNFIPDNVIGVYD
jgi:hypothetical protein